ncbi:selenocysteine-specific translation elongation factor [Arcobacter sp. YIC-464]|uniref:selenocysteine-specific translation elongation factor n=1 Tax=Arcobacter sp. YIC-464 TaxID=3376631 RepID=UPI003C2118DB
MSNIIIGTAGHIDHGKTALIKALNGYEGDSTKEEQQRGITIDLSFSNLTRGQQNIAFIDVPGHEKLIKNMIAGAFGFNCVMFAISAQEGIMPQTVEHIEIINLLGIKDVVIVITKKDLVSQDELKEQEKRIEEFFSEYDFDINFIQAVSVYEPDSIETLKDKLFSIKNKAKKEENFFRYYVDRVFSPKGIGTVVTGTVLGKPCELNEKVFLCQSEKQIKIKNIQVHNENALEANISNRAALNLQGINANAIQKGDLLSKKGFLRGFDMIDISFNTLKQKELKHNQKYTLFIGSKKLEVRVLLFDSTTSLKEGFATIKADEKLYTIFGEKIILRLGNDTIAGGKVLNPVADPMKKNQKRELLEALKQENFSHAYKKLLEAHKKGLGLISSSQRFALSHEEAIEFANNLENVYIDKEELIIYPIETKQLIIDFIKEIYTKNKYALLSPASINLRIKWASESFIEDALTHLVDEGFLVKNNKLYKSKDIEEDYEDKLKNIVLERLKTEHITPTAPYNIYDDLDLDRKLGDNILKSLTAKKLVIRLQHNLFIHSESLDSIVRQMKSIIQEDGFIEISNFKERHPLSRKYLITYLDYLDNFSNIKKDGNKRVLA